MKALRKGKKPKKFGPWLPKGGKKVLQRMQPNYVPPAPKLAARLFGPLTKPRKGFKLKGNFHDNGMHITGRNVCKLDLNKAGVNTQGSIIFTMYLNPNQLGLSRPAAFANLYQKFWINKLTIEYDTGKDYSYKGSVIGCWNSEPTDLLGGFTGIDAVDSAMTRNGISKNCNAKLQWHLPRMLHKDRIGGHANHQLFYCDVGSTTLEPKEYQQGNFMIVIENQLDTNLIGTITIAYDISFYGDQLDATPSGTPGVPQVAHFHTTGTGSTAANLMGSAMVVDKNFTPCILDTLTSTGFYELVFPVGVYDFMTIDRCVGTTLVGGLAGNMMTNTTGRNGALTTLLGVSTPANADTESSQTFFYRYNHWRFTVPATAGVGGVIFKCTSLATITAWDLLLYFCENTYALNSKIGKERLRVEEKKQEMKSLVDESVRAYMDNKEEKRITRLKEFRNEWEDLPSPGVEIGLRDEDRLYLQSKLNPAPKIAESKDDFKRVKSPERNPLK